MQSLVQLLYPSHCLACRAIVASDGGLCGACHAEVTFLDGLTCDSCALPLIGSPDEGPQLCDGCLADPPPWDRGRAVMLYDGAGRRIALSLKNGGGPELAPHLARWLSARLRGIVQPGTLVAPVPAHWLRRVARRYNQADLLASEVAAQLGCAYGPDLLLRTRATPKMDQMGTAERLTNVAGAFAIHQRRKGQIAGRRVLLIDDVMTSGATLREATTTCLAAGANIVSVATLARVAKRV